MNTPKSVHDWRWFRRQHGWEVSQMMKMADSGRGLVRCLGLAAAAILLLSAATSQRAEALSLINPGAAATAKQVSDGFTTEVRGGHGGGGHGGGGHGGGFHGGGFHAGGAVFHGGGGGYRAAHVFHAGGFRHGGFAFRHHHHFRRHFVYGPSYYDYPSYYPYRVCRVIRTYYGPRRICHFRHRHHHTWRHHHHRHHHYRYW
jgi:hypothetical protein